MATSEAKPRKKVLLVDDHAIMREGLTMLVSHEPDLCVCGEAEDVHSALEAIRQNLPDVVIADITLKEGSGIDLVKDIRTRWPKLPVVILSMHAQSMYAERSFRAGANGYVTKGEASAAIIEAIRAVLGGGVYVSKRLSSEMIVNMFSAKSDESRSLVDKLSDREFQVFELIGQGLRTSEIAERLFLSSKTVDAHREHIKRKLNIDSAPDLLKYAIQWVNGGGER
jgi:DNA-binding NarL/FixJ family response regulator